MGAWPPSSNYLPRLRAQHLLHVVSHGLYNVDCNVSDDGFRVRNIHAGDLISTASTLANKK